MIEDKIGDNMLKLSMQALADFTANKETESFNELDLLMDLPRLFPHLPTDIAEETSPLIFLYFNLTYS